MTALLKYKAQQKNLEEGVMSTDTTKTFWWLCEWGHPILILSLLKYFRKNGVDSLER